MLYSARYMTESFTLDFKFTFSFLVTGKIKMMKLLFLAQSVFFAAIINAENVKATTPRLRGGRNLGFLFHFYDECRICRDGSTLEQPFKNFTITNDFKINCLTASYAAKAGLLGDEDCAITVQKCPCIREELRLWPELVNMDVESATAAILGEINTADIQILPDNAFSSADIRKDRVRLYVNENNKVTRTPYCFC